MDLNKNVGPSYSRRLSIVSIGRALSIPFAVATLSPQPSLAEVVPGTTFISGRQPKVPGAKKRDPNDTKGTKKDPNFLRSVSDCKVTNTYETITSIFSINYINVSFLFINSQNVITLVDLMDWQSQRKIVCQNARIFVVHHTSNVHLQSFLEYKKSQS